ncbi:MAG: DUF4407 domain-containing protein [Proteobacteria bacterium]|nr:DUF4407 domain-containing protein [Pseudomonadota bacterium]
MNLQTILIEAAGSDQQLLVSGPRSEKFKHICKGVLATMIGVLSIISVTYALAVILTPQGALSRGEKLTNYGLCVALGLCWGLIIFNMYRFVLSSTGHGKGIERVSVNELANAMPKVFMAAFIAFCVSIPIGVALLRGQIESELSSTQIKLVASLDSDVDQLYVAKLDHLYSAQAHASEETRYLTDRLRRLSQIGTANRDKRNRQIVSRSVTSAAEERLALKAELDKTRKSLVALHSSTQELRDEIRKRKEDNWKLVKNADTLLNETERAFEQQMPLLLFLMLFMLLVHISPLLLQLLSNKSPYDYQVECQNEILLTKRGIAPDASMIQLLGRNRWIDRFSVAEKILEGRRLYLKNRQDLTRERLRQHTENA